MPEITFPQRLFTGILLVLFALITPVLTQTRLNEPTAIDITDTKEDGSSAAKPRQLSIDDYEKLVAAEPENLVAANNLGVLYYNAGRFDEAAKLIVRAADGRRDSWNLQQNASIVMSQRGTYDAALRYAQAAFKMAPKELAVHQEMCDMYLATQHGTEAADCYASILGEYKRDPGDLLGYGEAMLLTGDLARAESVIKESIAGSPRYAAAYNALGMVQYQRKHYTDAVDAFREAISLRPEEARYRFNMAVVQMAMSNKSGALSQYNMLKQSDPKLASQLYNAMFADKLVSVAH